MSLSLFLTSMSFISPPSLFLTLQLSPLISLALRISHHHSLLFSLSVGDRVKCRCSPNSPVTGSHLLLPPEYIWNHWLQRSQSKSNLSYKGNAFKLKGLCGGSDLCVFFFIFLLCVSAKPTLLYCCSCQNHSALTVPPICPNKKPVFILKAGLLTVWPCSLTSRLCWPLLFPAFQTPWTRETVRWSAPPWKSYSIWWCLRTWWERLWCPTTDRSSPFSTSSKTWTVSSSHACGQMVCQRDVSVHFCEAVIVCACPFVL